MKYKPLITFGITAFQEGELLKDAIDSVINQNNKLWECILVLDGGADQKTTQIYNDFSHPCFIKYQFSNNQGPYTTRRKAIDLSTTKWYCHIDGDDMITKNCFEILINAIKNNKDADILYGDIEFIYSKKQKIISYKNINKNKLPFFLYGTVVIKKQIFYELNGFEKKLNFGSADRDFLIKCAQKNKVFIYVGNHVIYKARKLPNSNSAKWTNDISLRNYLVRYYHSKYALYYIKKKHYKYFFYKDIRPMLKHYYQKKQFLKLLYIILILGYESNMIVLIFIIQLISGKINDSE